MTARSRTHCGQRLSGQNQLVQVIRRCQACKLRGNTNTGSTQSHGEAWFSRPSRSGDQFHYQWAARQCLGLLADKDGLVAISIEGPSHGEGNASTDAGDEVIDVGLHYGCEELMKARAFYYVQTKHSSRQVHTAWTASGLAKTIAGFAKRFKELQCTLGSGRPVSGRGRRTISAPE